MKNSLKIGLAAIAFSAVSMLSSGSAFAWGCIAVSGEGSYGYSYSYDNQEDAAARALNECAAKTSTSETCEITECTEGS